LTSCATRVAFSDDLLDGEPADDRTQVTSEDPAHQDLHPVLLGQEPAGGVRDRCRVVADLERGDGPDIQPDSLFGDAVLDDLGFLEREGEHPGLLLDRQHDAAVPCQILNWVSSRRRLEPEISSASFGAGTRQTNMTTPAGDELTGHPVVARLIQA
jgi:hypothetical protein